jgi:hypothetical protein
MFASHVNSIEAVLFAAHEAGMTSPGSTEKPTSFPSEDTQAAIFGKVNVPLAALWRRW